MFGQLPDHRRDHRGDAKYSPKAPAVGTLETLTAVEDDDRYAQVAKEAGFSLHAGIAAQA